MLRYFFTNEDDTPVDDLINKLLEEMRTADMMSEEYLTMLSRLERLYKVKAEYRQSPVSRDTLALVAGNLIGILLIVAYENKHVMTSKGFSQIIRPK